MGCAGSTCRWSSSVDLRVFPSSENILQIKDQEAPAHSCTSYAKAVSIGDERTGDIAIVGVGCRTPGADNLRDFWRLLENGECHVTDIPADRWDAAAYLDPDPMATGKAYVQKGGFIKDLEGFDHGLYGINSYEAGQMDHQQCLLLDCTSMALEDAGIPWKQISGSTTGVFVGAMNCDYRMNNVGTISSKVSNYTSTGTANSILANRLSYVFNLTGPSMVLDTACSASMVAIHQGCQAIRAGECGMAICGGVNSITTPDMYVYLSKARLISPTGLCHTFSDEADGYTRGEGCGIVLLKRVEDALRDGDKVWGIVRTATNQDGRTVSPLTSPSGSQQKKLLHTVYDKFQMDIAALDYIEAHGTGTPVGDAVETNALGSFLKERGQARERCIGSVKTNIGHTESAAGVLGVIKVLLMMKKDTIVPSLHCHTVNPKINLAALRFKIPKDTIPWLKTQKLAGCNSFGFGGSNCHAILSSNTECKSPKEECKSPCIVCFSGKTVKSLKGSLEDLYADDEAALLDIHDVSYTSTIRRNHHSHRAAFVVEDMQDLLIAAGEKLSHNNLALPVSSQLNIVFVFCGMGTAWDGMCRQLFAENKVFRDTMLSVENCLSSHVSWSLTERLLQEDPSKDPILNPVAVFACQVSLFALWQSLGIQPYCVVGQSFGEVAAAYSAGCFSLQDAVNIVFHRTKLLAQVLGGAMIIVQNAEVNKVRQIVADLDKKASISLQYSPTACAVSASAENMPKIRQQLLSKLRPANRAMKVIDLDVSVAYHSSHVEPCVEKLLNSLNGLIATQPKVQFISSTTGWVVTTKLDAKYWADNMRNPVLFSQAISQTVDNKASVKTVFLEIGPKPVLRAHLKDLFPGKEILAVPSMSPQAEQKCILQALVSLYELGADINWKNLPSHGTEAMDVPRYAFDKKYVREKTEAEVIVQGGINVYQSSHLYVSPIQDNSTSFNILVSPLVAPSVYEHVLSGKILVAGAFYVEAGLAIAQYRGAKYPLAVSVEFQHALLLEKDEVTDIQAVIELQKTEQAVIKKNGRQLATIQILESSAKSHEAVNIDYIRSHSNQEMDKKEIYEVLRQSGFEYGPSFSVLERAYKSSDKCLTVLKISDAILKELQGTIIHPCILDGVFQSPAVVMSERKNGRNDLLPQSVRKLVVHGPVEPEMFVYTQLTRQTPKTVTFDQQLLSVSGRVIAEVIEFSLQTLTADSSTSLPTMISAEWHKQLDASQLKVQESSKDKRKVIFVTDSDSIDMKHCLSVRINGQISEQKLRQQLKTTIESNQDIVALVMACTRDATAETDGNAVHSHLVNMCLVVQTTLKLMGDMGLTTPFYLCTFYANEAMDGNHPVNPAATALLGLLRTVFMENTYSYVYAVDVQTPQDKTGYSLQALFKALRDRKEVQDYPEIVIASSGVFVNQIVPTSLSVSIPQQRMCVNTPVGKLEGNMIILSEEPNTIISPLAVRVESRPKEDNTEVMMLRASCFAQPDERLLGMVMSSSHVLPGRTHTPRRDYVVTAIEVCGQALGESKDEWVSCSPQTVGPQVAAPTATMVPTSAIQHYQPGDLTKLVLLWKLCSHVTSETVSILTSPATESFASVTKAILCAAKQNAARKVSILQLKDIGKVTSSEETVLSLVYLDSNVMSSLCANWKGGERFVTLKQLVSQESVSVVVYALPCVHVHTVDTQVSFQYNSTGKIVPEIRDWLAVKKGQLSEVFVALHSTSDSKGCNDIGRLMEFKCLALDKVNVSLEQSRFFLKDAAYIVVGGLTGLGWICVEFLAQNNAGYIAIMNRRAPNKEQEDKMEELSLSCSCQIQTYQADVTSMMSVQEAFTLLQQKAGHCRLRGIFMGAAMIDDGFFATMEKAAFERVLAPKVKGAWNLHQLTKDIPLDYFVLHSSVASVLGNLGQANYSAGNAFLDGLAFYRRSLGLAAQTINWGPLDTGLLDNQDDIRQKLRAMGFDFATHSEIRDTLASLLLLNWTQAVPVKIDPELYGKRIYSSGFVPLTVRLKKIITKPQEDSSSSASGPLVNAVAIKLLPAEERLQAYEAYVCALTSRVLNLEDSQISSDTSLLDLGLDSVLGMIMINQIHRDTSFKLAAVDIVTGHATVASLAKTLVLCASNTDGKGLSETGASETRF